MGACRLTIALSDVLQIDNLHDFKVHFARYNKVEQPLDVFARSRLEWQGWQESYPGRNDFNRPYIFALAQFYHETDVWLFGGIFNVLGISNEAYDVQLSDQFAGLVGRLKVRTDYRSRTTRTNMENHFDRFEVVEILRDPYGGREFPGYYDIDLSFAELEAIVRNERPDWRAALSSIKGIYMISDVSTGKRYVGSAYGEFGVWGRWRDYVETGHGWNVGLRDLVGETSTSYARTNFRFALLEHRPVGLSDEMIIQREAYWKKVLFTREMGLNKN